MSKDTVDDALVQRAEKALDKRLSGKRLQHSHGVAETARGLAEVYGVDPNTAYVAGLLHDWDKQLPKEDMCERAKSLGIELKKSMCKTPSVLHGVTAAAALPSEFGELPQPILDAIARHTVPVANMTPLDEIVYVADKIEPGRPARDTSEVRSNVGKVSLQELYLETFSSSLSWLLETRRPIYKGSIKVWNELMAQSAKK